MQADTLISRMVLAHLVIQLFVDRVFLGLEDPLSFSDMDSAKDEWGWMSRFRVWEANRQVFLYPENYIEPELRDDKTEFFQELEDEILQETITDDSATTALSNYLEKMNEVSNLEIVGSYAEGGSLGVNGVLHVVGRTRSEPRTFYYRSFIAKQVSQGTWNPWIKIPVDIKGDVVAPVVFNGHLHLYWPAITVKQRPDPPKKSPTSGDPLTITGDNVADEHHTTYAAEIKLMGTEYIPSQNKWLKPTVSQARAIDEDAPSPFENEVGEILPATDNYHLRVGAVGKDFVSIQLIKTHTPEPPTTETTARAGPGCTVRRVFRAGLSVAPDGQDRGHPDPPRPDQPGPARDVPVLVHGRGHLRAAHGRRGRRAVSGQELADPHRPQAQRSRPGATSPSRATSPKTSSSSTPTSRSSRRRPTPYRVFDTNFGLHRRGEPPVLLRDRRARACSPSTRGWSPRRGSPRRRS